MTKKRRTLKWLAVAAFAGWLPGIGLAAAKVPVVASFSILGDLARVVGGGRVQVTTLVGPNADTHAYEPRPADAKTLLASRLFVVNGLNFEPWAEKLAQSCAYSGPIVWASQGVQPRRHIPDHGPAETDPHAWQNPDNVAVYVRNIAEALGKIDPAGAAAYRSNSDAYIKQLTAFDAWAKAEMAALAPKQRQVITSHDAFGYFADHYQVRFLAPQGINADTEPSAKAVGQLIRQILRERIRAVFVENMRNPQLLAQIARDTGVTLGPRLYVDALSAPKEPAASYLDMMRHNVTQLVAGMRLN